MARPAPRPARPAPLRPKSPPTSVCHHTNQCVCTPPTSVCGNTYQCVYICRFWCTPTSGWRAVWLQAGYKLVTLTTRLQPRPGYTYEASRLHLRHHKISCGGARPGARQSGTASPSIGQREPMPPNMEQPGTSWSVLAWPDTAARLSW
jgi:hypothetical protein